MTGKDNSAKGDSAKDDYEKLTGQQQSDLQVGVTDMTNRMSEVMHDAFGFGRLRVPGQKTNFEDHELNDMLDIVEHTNPADLESAGEALWKAQKAISDAATELRGHLKAAEDDWQGEAGKAFQIWGTGLAGHADDLAEYAKAAGVQITSAGTGLASVRSAMPPRDTRMVRTSVKDIPVVARIDTNHDYVAATKVEGHRQEAINQMNRLSSFYVVSEQSLKGLKPPTFEAMPNVGVPKPTGGSWSSVPTGRESGTFQHHAPPTDHTTVQPHPTDVRHANVGLDPIKYIPDSTGHPVRDIGTAIDSVETLPQHTPTSVTNTTTPTTPTTGPQGLPLPPYVQGGPNPLAKGQVGRPFGPNGMPRTQASAQGRAGTGPVTARGLGQTGTNPMGRPSATGQAGVKGGMPGGRPTAMGHGVTGGTAKPAGTPSGRQGMGPRGTGRGDSGVIGGKPTTTGASAKPGSKVPKGTVIGGEGATGSGTSRGGISQRGVMGAPSATNSAARNQMPGRGSLGGSDGVTGTPAGRNPGSRAGRNGFTAGGSGLVRGSEVNRSADQETGDGVQRPDHLVEDEQTHVPKKPQRDVPPVID
ncbi:hypothetical protein EOT10_21225 [Streptomyces antnestii]|uniref:WXG100 family type VII secretion target n=1 Tax=Streptomyces antnestii TaxID=2494256 RepID=A0A437PJP6_9ACTN|nr:WXG100 family type VII secretion target [Streptomyces sp. San01]RVU22491.1 hypothetical protein EOT10_21225 [Streptomyces sp. San01]